MAGKNQHYIPKFLQKAFATGNDEDYFFTWKFQRGQPATSDRIDNIGAETFFYTYRSGKHSQIIRCRWSLVGV